MSKKTVLGWTRDEKGKVVDRHPVDVANAVTSAKRDNTQNYVVEEPTCVAMRGRDPQTLTKKRTEYGKQIRKDYEAHKVSEQRKNIQQLEPRTDGVTNTLTGVQKDNLVSANMRIRKLTERECFRLMGVRDEDIDRIQAAGISRTQQYKMAGNSIVVNCLTAIFRQLFIGNFNKAQQTEIF